MYCLSNENEEYKIGGKVQKKSSVGKPEGQRLVVVGGLFCLQAAVSV
jgi:hypothetical protein